MISNTATTHSSTTQNDGTTSRAVPTPSDGRALSIFLCHSSGDKQTVRNLYDRLTADGFAPWLDEKLLLPGQDWREQIQIAVKACDIVMVCLSEKSVSKEGYLNREIKDALDAADEKPEGTIFVIPVRLDEVEVPRRLSRWQWADLFKEDGYSRLVTALNARSRELNLHQDSSPEPPVHVNSGLREEPVGSSPSVIKQQPSVGKTRRARLKPVAGVVVIALVAFLGGVLIEGQVLGDLFGGHKRINQNPNNSKLLSDDPMMGNVAAEIGLNAIEYGKYTTEENNRLIASIRNANNIKMLFVNGDNVFQTFKQEFQAFLSKPSSSMQVLLATPNSNFYREETEMTKLDAKSGDLAYTANQMKVEFNRQRLLGLAVDPSQIQFRYFDTQYRLPLIIIDNKSCYLTLRLSPNESQQSVRLEFEGGTHAYAESCLAHFNRMWALSRTLDEKLR